MNSSSGRCLIIFISQAESSFLALLITLDKSSIAIKKTIVAISPYFKKFKITQMATKKKNRYFSINPIFKFTNNRYIKFVPVNYTADFLLNCFMGNSDQGCNLKSHTPIGVKVCPLFLCPICGY